MFTTYAVRLQDGQKLRFVVGTYESEDEARRVADLRSSRHRAS
jgi:hypothetical protein